MATATVTKRRTKSLTASEQRALAAARSEWLAVGLSTEPANRPEAEAAVRDLYAVMGWKEPMMVWMGSPLGGCFAATWFAGIVKADSKKSQLYDQLYGQLRNQLLDQLVDQLHGQLLDQLVDQLRGQLRNQLLDQLVDQLHGQLLDQLVDQLHGQLYGQLLDQLLDQLVDQLYDQLYGQLRNQLLDQLYGQLRNQLLDQLRGQLYTARRGQHEAWWVAWLHFAREVGVVYDKHLDQGLEAWSRITRSCGWWWPREGVVILTERPRVLHRDDAGRLHREDGPAISYPDGWGVWAWHGIRVEQEIIEDPDALTVERITNEQNAELRRTYMEIYGQGRYMQEAGGELLDEVHEPLFPGLTDAKLWRLPNPDGGEPFVCVECRNSTAEPDGSYKTYYQWVHPELRPLPEKEGEALGEPQELTVHAALASTYGCRAEDYTPSLET